MRSAGRDGDRAGAAVRGARVLLGVVGLLFAGYGAGLLRPELVPALPWLVAGPVLFDLVVAPLVLATGLLLARTVADPARRIRIGTGLAVTAVLSLIATPLLLRPAPAPPNPGLQDRDYLAGLAVWFAVLWGAVALGCIRPAAVVARPGR